MATMIHTHGMLEGAAPPPVTANDTEAAWPPTSVAVTEVPDAPLGTSNVQLNVPVLPVVSDPLAQLEMAAESKTNEERGVDTENPVPETVTVAPTGAWGGFTVIVGVVTVNTSAVARAPVAVSSATNEYAPAASLGTVNVQTNRPESSVVIVPPDSVPSVHFIGTTSTEFKVTVAPDDQSNPEPVTVKVAPVGPWVGPIEITGAVTTTCPDADEVAVSGADALSVTWISNV